MGEFPHNAVVVRFGTGTPFWVLSMSYGIFMCHSARKMFHSPDQYIAYQMLVRPEHRARIMSTPNGYLAYTNLEQILTENVHSDDVVSPTWEEDRDQVMLTCLQLKYSQSAILADILLRTENRPIIDDSRNAETHWCHGGGRGENKHGLLLERVRSELSSGELLPMVGRNRQNF